MTETIKTTLTFEQASLILTLLKVQHKDENFSDLFICIDKYKDVRFRDLHMAKSSGGNPCLIYSNDGRSLITCIFKSDPPLFVVWESCGKNTSFWNRVPRQIDMQTVLKHISFEDKV